MLIKSKPTSMEVVKSTLTPRAKCTLVDLLNKAQRRNIILWQQTDERYIIHGKGDALYYIIYNLSKHFDIEIM